MKRNIAALTIMKLYMWFEWSIEIDILVNCSWVSNTKNDVEIVQYVYIYTHTHTHTHTHILLSMPKMNKNLKFLVEFHITIDSR